MVIALMPTSQAIAAKAGKRCANPKERVITTSSILVCRNVKGKLLWVVVRRQSIPPTPRPTPTPTPTPTKAIPLEVLYGQRLLDQLRTKADTAQQFSNYIIEVEPILKGTYWAQTQTEGIARAFAYLYALDVVPSSKISIFVNWTDDWLRQKLIAANASCASNTSFAGGGFCFDEFPVIYANAGWFAANWGLQISDTAAPSKYLIGLVGNMPHEIAHAGQIRGYEKNGIRNWRFVPAWLREGWAELFKVLYFADSRKLSFADAHKLYVQQSSLRCLNYSIRDLSGNRSHPEQDYCEYPNGYFATLKLLQTVNDVDLLFRLAGASGTTQEETFKATFGLDYEEFIKQADNFTRQALNDRS